MVCGGHGREKEPSLWFFLLSDSVTLGFVRLGVIAVAVYAIASIPALIMGGRWVKAFGLSGVTADHETKDALDKAQELSGAPEAGRRC